MNKTAEEGEQSCKNDLLAFWVSAVLGTAAEPAGAEQQVRCELFKDSCGRMWRQHTCLG
jgi:hypothetical protein